MSTEKQIESNRANAIHSTGPVTAQGKASAALNHFRHGLCYNRETFKVLPCEDQSDYDSMAGRLHVDHMPVDCTEELLVVSMAQHRWLGERALRLQDTALDPNTAQITDQKLFALYLRYATTHERAFHQCITQLLKLRSERNKTQIGFESQKHFAEQHEMKRHLHDMELCYRQSKINREEGDERRAEWLFERQKTVVQAA